MIYSNIKEKTRYDNLITGRASLILEPDKTIAIPSIEITENQEFVNEPFYNECVETCFISLPFSPDISHNLIFYIGENTKLKITKISYTIASE